MSHPWISIDDYWIFQRGGKVFSSLLNISLKPEKCVCPLLEIRPKFTLSSHKYFSLKPQIFVCQATNISLSSHKYATSISASSHKYCYWEDTNFSLSSHKHLSSNHKYFSLKLLFQYLSPKQVAFICQETSSLNSNISLKKPKKMKNETWHNLFHKWYFKQNFSRSLDHGNCCPICKSFTAYRKSSLH